jgi:hypothetical protein
MDNIEEILEFRLFLIIMGVFSAKCRSARYLAFSNFDPKPCTISEYVVDGEDEEERRKNTALFYWGMIRYI